MNSSFFMVQAQEKLPVFLSNYTFSGGRTEVGRITLGGKTVRNVEISGDHAKVFTVRDGVISILPEYNLKGAQYDIIISARNKGAVVLDTFKIISDEFIQNKVIAHRGAWKNTGVPENSIAALKHAVNLGCAGSEFDVHMSADSVLLINHDPSFQNISIGKTEAQELTQLKLSNGESLPTLVNYLKEGISQNTTKLILEIKPSAVSKEHSIATAREVVCLVKALKAQAWIDYISFDYEICKELQRLDPFARVAYLNGDKSPQELKKDNLWGYDYHFSVLKKNPDWLSIAKQEGLTTNAWTVNDKDTMMWLLERGIDFITTNEPELLLEMVKK
ncbi:glycerophosphodiester phosphodiesterase [Paradesertivirga mongoliensis]|uniref:Glycerophosphodiester phosphodiesterase n=1 Tax=Paradesertivirga mongoliensis TaxID=2100740 RepID=A0ABW4ZFQ1_9SPHI|nr:glycerophosphodiester phosphodiesterase family protein [Pedobacter mongoliensis]